MSTYSSNTTTKVQAGVDFTGLTTTSVIPYTVPANSYAVVSMYVTTNGGGSHTIYVAGNQIDGSAPSHTIYNFYVGPSQSIEIVQNSGTTTNYNLMGVEFKNSP